jgi:hypothetical protein
MWQYHIINPSWQFMAQPTEGFADSPLDLIASDRIAKASTDRDAQAGQLTAISSDKNSNMPISDPHAVGENAVEVPPAADPGDTRQGFAMLRA